MYGYLQNYNPYQLPQQPQQEVTKVNGENGARAYPMGANSSALLLDNSGLLVWLVTTDGASYKTVSAYDITPHKAEPTPDYNTLEKRIERLEGLINDTSNITAARKSEPITKGKWFYVYEIELDFTNADEALFIVTQDIEAWDTPAEWFADDC